MFTFAFVLLLAMSVGSLLFSVSAYISKAKEIRTANPSPVLAAALILLACILALDSDFKYRIVALALMVVSILLDYRYYKRRSESKFTTRPSKRRLYWQLFDNSAWIAVVIVLYTVK